MQNPEKNETNYKNRNIAFVTTLIISMIMFTLIWYIKVWKEEKSKPELLSGKGFLVNLNNPTKLSGKDIETDLRQKNDIPTTEKSNKNDVSIQAKVIEKKTVLTSKLNSPVVEKVTPNTENTNKVNKEALLPSKKRLDNEKTLLNGNGKGVKDDENKTGDSPIGYLPNRNPKISSEIVKPDGMLNITGWTWTNKPTVMDDSDETGVIKFRIKVDADGDVVDVNHIESTVSPAVVQQYKRAVQKTKFKPTSDGDKPDISTGTVTFRLNPR
jgi:periplasmic protein TonB